MKQNPKKSRFFKIFGGLSLATLITCATVLSFTPIFSTPTTATTTPTQSTTSPLGLNPETDPVVYTTESGLEIKYANSLTNPNLAGYTYFEMGSYAGTPINWIIIGYDPSVSHLVGNYTNEVGTWNKKTVLDGYNWWSTIDYSPAGIAIVNSGFCISTQAVSNDEIGQDCFLCLSEYNIYSTQTTHNYNGSALHNKMNNLYETELDLNDEQKSFIMPQYLTNLFQSISYTSNAYMFPLAGRGEEFDINTYLTIDDLKISYSLGTTTASNYWLRSGHQSDDRGTYQVDTHGSVVNSYYTLSSSLGIRPAFVMKLP